MTALEQQLTAIVNGEEAPPFIGAQIILSQVILSFGAFLREFKTSTLRYSIERERRLEEIIRMFYANASLELQQIAPLGDESWKSVVEDHAILLLRVLIRVLEADGWDETRPKSLRLLRGEIDRIRIRAAGLRSRHPRSAEPSTIESDNTMSMVDQHTVSQNDSDTIDRPLPLVASTLAKEADSGSSTADVHAKNGPNIFANLESMLSLSDYLIKLLKNIDTDQMALDSLVSSSRKLNFLIEFLVVNLKSMTVEELGFESNAQDAFMRSSTDYLYNLQGIIEIAERSQTERNHAPGLANGASLMTLAECADTFAAALSPIRGRVEHPQPDHITLLKDAQPSDPSASPDGYATRYYERLLAQVNDTWPDVQESQGKLSPRPMHSSTKEAASSTAQAEQEQEQAFTAVDQFSGTTEAAGIATAAWFAAVHRNGWFGIQKLLSEGFNVDQRDGDMHTALHYAAKRDSVDMAKMLLKANADLSIPLPQGNTALHVAAQCGHVDMVKLLLDHGGKVNARNWARETPLVLAVQQHAEGVLGVVEVLLAKGAITRFSWTSTILHIALANDRTDDIGITRLLLGADADLLSLLDEQGRTSLHICVLYRLKRHIAYLLQREVDLNVRDNAGQTPMDLLFSTDSDHKRVDIFNLLVRGGGSYDLRHVSPDVRASMEAVARQVENLPTIVEPSILDQLDDLNASDMGESPEAGPRLVEDPSLLHLGGATELFHAIERSDEHAVTSLLAAGADPDSFDDSKTPALIRAAQTDNTRILTALWNRKANLNIRNKEGQTALHRAAKYDCGRSVRFLLGHGADVAPLDASDNTPFLLAVRRGADNSLLKAFADADEDISKAILFTLLEWRPDPVDALGFFLDANPALLNDRAAGSGWTPLHYAVSKLAVSSVSLLVARGAHVNAATIVGATPMRGLLRQNYDRQDYSKASMIFTILRDSGAVADETMSDLERTRFRVFEQDSVNSLESHHGVNWQVGEDEHTT